MTYQNQYRLGDKLYGMPEAEYLAWRDAPHEKRPCLPWRRQALHCNGVTFVHPFTGAQLTVQAPLPESFNEIEQKLLGDIRQEGNS